MEDVLLAVNGTLMRGLTLNENLHEVNAKFIKETTTSNQYRMWTINDHYPAMQRSLKGGAQIDVEIWQLTPESLLNIIENEPPGLCLGKVEIIDEGWIFGVLGEDYICQDRREITQWGGWRNYLSRKNDDLIP